ncbi:MAG: RHS repeat-associated core domain-containing protein [Armatimonadota bacterium]|nr:RHS repeat-associated core domain-containing protein [Armatimonadota bacterium]
MRPQHTRACHLLRTSHRACSPSLAACSLPALNNHAARRVSRIEHRQSDLTEIATLDYEYDGVGNPTKIVREDGAATYYSYDDIYQLTGEAQVDAQGAPIFEAQYDYDGAHNRTVKVVDGTPTYYAYNEANQLLTETTGEETVYYSYDGCGNTIAKQEAAGITYYVYDVENLMTRIDFPDDGHSYYSYDADSKRVDQRTPDGFREFVYQGPDMLKLQLERDESETTVAHYTMGDGLEAMRRDNESSFYHFNHLGTAIALTGADEAVTDTYRHDAWGVLLESTGATVNPHTYVGRERYYRMPNAAMYHLGLRDYAQGSGRLLTQDPLEQAERFAYSANRPTTFTDPSGQWGCDPLACAKRSRTYDTPKRPFERTFKGICPSGFPGTYHVMYEKWWEVREVWKCVPDPDSYWVCYGKEACRRVDIIPHRKIGRRRGKDWFCIPDFDRIPPVPTPPEWDEWRRRCGHICRVSCEIVGLIACVLICTPVTTVPPIRITCDVVCHEVTSAVTCESLCDGLCEENWHW